MSDSAEYYRNNPRARRKKKRTDTAINSRPEQVQKRVEANRARRKARRRGKNIKNKDYDHATNRFTSVKANRGRRGEGNR